MSCVTRQLRWYLVGALLGAWACAGATSSDSSPADADLDEGASTSLEPIDGACSDDGCLRWALFLGDIPWLELTGYLPAGTVIEHGYSIWQLGYVTDGRDAVATVTVPFGVESPEDGWHVVVNNPGTVGVGDVCAPSRSAAAVGLAGLFGARSLVGVTLDYPGLGTEGTHPYLVAEVNAKASLDALRAVQSLSARFGVALSGRMAMAGLSQGGHTTLSAARVWPTYAPELDIRAFAAAAPASVFAEHWVPHIGTPGSHMAYHALLVYAWSQFYGGSALPLWLPELADTIDEIMEEHCLYSATELTLNTVLGTDAEAIFDADFISAYAAGDFSSYGFMELGFSENRLTAFEQTVPIRIYQGSDDLVVLSEDTAEWVEHFNSAGMAIELVEVSGGSHEDIAFGYLATPQSHTFESLEWLRVQLDASP